MQVNSRDFLAFESFNDKAPQELWRVSSIREFKEKPIRHINWFNTEEAARTHEKWLNDGRATDVFVAHYILDAQPQGGRP